MLEELCKRNQHCCTTLWQKKCWELLAEKCDRFQTLRNNTRQHPTTCNRVCKGTQHVTSNNVASVWTGLNITTEWLNNAVRTTSCYCWTMSQLFSLSISIDWYRKSIFIDDWYRLLPIIIDYRLTTSDKSPQLIFFQATFRIYPCRNNTVSCNSYW